LVRERDLSQQPEHVVIAEVGQLGGPIRNLEVEVVRVVGVVWSSERIA